MSLFSDKPDTRYVHFTDTGYLHFVATRYVHFSGTGYLHWRVLGTYLSRILGTYMSLEHQERGAANEKRAPWVVGRYVGFSAVSGQN